MVYFNNFSRQLSLSLPISLPGVFEQEQEISYPIRILYKNKREERQLIVFSVERGTSKVPRRG